MKIDKFKNGITFNGDCLKILDALIQKGIKVDAIITDPPYNIARENNFTSIGRRGIDFGEWDKEADILSWINKIPKILNKNGCVFIFNAWENLGDISKKMKENDIDVKDCFRYIKSNPMPRNRDRRYITDYEYAIWGVRQKSKWAFNRQSETYERPEFKCAIEKGFHITQKPLSLMEHILKIHTNENDVVLDCFAGSMTTCVACQNLKRKFIGIELDNDYYDKAVKRLQENEDK